MWGRGLLCRLIIEILVIIVMIVIIVVIILVILFEPHNMPWLQLTGIATVGAIDGRFT